MDNFLQQILHLAVRFDLSVTSWIRSTKHNGRVGGKSGSMHLLGLAVDVVLDDPDQTDFFILACNRIGLMALNEKDHIHVQIPHYEPY